MRPYYFVVIALLKSFVKGKRAKYQVDYLHSVDMFKFPNACNNDLVGFLLDGYINYNYSSLSRDKRGINPVFSS